MSNKPENTEIILIHSRFNQEDRKVKETKILELFEKKDSNVILVATQVIEVGIDISADKNALCLLSVQFFNSKELDDAQEE